MRRHKSLLKLSREHHKGLLLAQLLKKDAPQYRGLPTDTLGKTKYAIDEWHLRIEPHFANEENILIPNIKNLDAAIDEILNEIEVEHAELKSLFSRLDENIENIDFLDEIGRKLESHIRKEERILFEQVQSKIDKKKLSIIENEFNKLNNSGNKSC